MISGGADPRSGSASSRTPLMIVRPAVGGSPFTRAVLLRWSPHRRAPPLVRVRENGPPWEDGGEGFRGRLCSECHPAHRVPVIAGHPHPLILFRLTDSRSGLPATSAAGSRRPNFVGRCRLVSSGNGVPTRSATGQTRPVGPATVNPCDTATRCPPTPVDDLSTGVPDDPWRTAVSAPQRPRTPPRTPITHYSKVITDDPAQDWQTRSRSARSGQRYSQPRFAWSWGAGAFSALGERSTDPDGALPECLDSRAVVQCRHRTLGAPCHRGGHIGPVVHPVLPVPGDARR